MSAGWVQFLAIILLWLVSVGHVANWFLGATHKSNPEPPTPPTSYIGIAKETPNGIPLPPGFYLPVDNKRLHLVADLTDADRESFRTAIALATHVPEEGQ